MKRTSATARSFALDPSPDSARRRLQGLPGAMEEGKSETQRTATVPMPVTAIGSATRRRAAGPRSGSTTARSWDQDRGVRREYGPGDGHGKQDIRDPHLEEFRAGAAPTQPRASGMDPNMNGRPTAAARRFPSRDGIASRPPLARRSSRVSQPKQKAAGQGGDVSPEAGGRQWVEEKRHPGETRWGYPIGSPRSHGPKRATWGRGGVRSRIAFAAVVSLVATHEGGDRSRHRPNRRHDWSRDQVNRIPPEDGQDGAGRRWRSASPKSRLGAIAPT